jgi:hypothetical protein
MREFTHMIDLLEHVQTVVDSHVQGMRVVTASQLGLDPRCGRAYVDTSMDYIVVDAGSAGSYNYYGGFEYIDRDDVRTMGDYVIYLSNSDRVQDALDALMEHDGACESEDA